MTQSNNPVCQLCNGTYWREEIRDGEIAPWPCACLRKEMMFRFLGPELARAKHRKSELFMPELDPETNQIIGDRTVDNLFIKGVWAEAAAHLRWALSGKKADTPGFSFRLVNDEKLLRVYLGQFSYSNRSKKVRDDLATYNNLSDLISDCSLLIVRLGQLAYKNVAAGDVLQEALNIRASESKPTWLIEGEVYFGDGHKCYNDTVGRYVESNFEVIDVGGDVKAARELRASMQALGETVAMGLEIEPHSGSMDTKEAFTAEPGALQNRGRSKFKKWGRGGRNNSGGGLPGL